MRRMFNMVATRAPLAPLRSACFALVALCSNRARITQYSANNVERIAQCDEGATSATSGTQWSEWSPRRLP